VIVSVFGLFWHNDRVLYDGPDDAFDGGPERLQEIPVCFSDDGERLYLSTGTDDTQTGDGVYSGG
ncbi:MAG: hypothetical protein ACYSUV_20820, partial [Planctomycetota bacterium]